MDRNTQRGFNTMARRTGWKPTAPTQVIYFISLVLAILSLLAALAVIPGFVLHAYWLALIAYAVLAVGCALKGV